MKGTWICKALFVSVHGHTRAAATATTALGLLQGTGQEMQRKSAQVYLSMLPLRVWTVGMKHRQSSLGAWSGVVTDNSLLGGHNMKNTRLNPPPSQIWKAMQGRKSLARYKARTMTHFSTSWHGLNPTGNSDPIHPAAHPHQGGGERIGQVKAGKIVNLDQNNLITERE